VSPFVQVAWGEGVSPPPAGLAVESTITGNIDALQSAHDITLPSGIQNGDLAILHVRFGAGTGSLSLPVSGWTTLRHSDSSGVVWVGYRVCDGSEGSTITLTHNDATSRSAWVGYRISGQAASSFIEHGYSTAMGTAPSVTPSWGSAENLWLDTLSARSSDWSVATPTNWSDQISGQNPTTTTSTRSKVVSVQRVHTASSLTAPSWDLTNGGGFGAERWLIIAVRPA